MESIYEYFESLETTSGANLHLYPPILIFDYDRELYPY